MLSKIAGLMKSEMSRAAAVLVAQQSKFLSLLDAFKEKVPGEETAAEAPAAEEEPPAGAGPAAETEETAEAEASSEGEEE